MAQRRLAQSQRVSVDIASVCPSIVLPSVEQNESNWHSAKWSNAKQIWVWNERACQAHNTLACFTRASVTKRQKLNYVDNSRSKTRCPTEMETVLAKAPDRLPASLPVKPPTRPKPPGQPITIVRCAAFLIIFGSGPALQRFFTDAIRKLVFLRVSQSLSPLCNIFGKARVECCKELYNNYNWLLIFAPMKHSLP